MVKKKKKLRKQKGFCIHWLQSRIPYSAVNLQAWTLTWPRSSFGFFCTILQDKLLAQPKISNPVCYRSHTSTKKAVHISWLSRARIWFFPICLPSERNSNNNYNNHRESWCTFSSWSYFRLNKCCICPCSLHQEWPSIVFSNLLNHLFYFPAMLKRENKDLYFITTI